MALTDPTDWPGSMPDLRTIDNLLRCSICFEYLNIAMIIPACSHNYCSLCIRRYLKYKRQCPSCNVEVSTAQLCNNRTLDELVRTFVAIRPYILKMCKKEQNSKPPDEDVSSDDQAFEDKPTPKSSTTLTSHFTAMKSSRIFAPAITKQTIKSSISSDDLNRSSEENVSPKRKPPGTPGNQPNWKVIDSPLAGGDFAGAVDEESAEEMGQSVASTSSSPATGQLTPGGSRDKAVCPVCGVPVTAKYINTHLDACLNRTEQPKTRTPKRKPIPPMLWKLVPEKDIRKKLKENNLSTKGKRYDLVKRLDEFILMYNAQCDSSNPKSGLEIAKEVERLEQLKSQPKERKEVLVHKLKIKDGLTEEELQTSQKEYMTAHKNQFGKLIAQARERMKKSKTKSQKSASQSSQDSSPDTMGTETLSSLPQDASQDVANTKEDAPCSDLNPKEDTNDKDDVVIEEDNTNKVRIMDLGLPSVSKRKDGKKKRKRLGKLVSDGRSREQEIQDGVSQESDLELSERSQKLKPGLLAALSGLDVQESEGEVLAPSSPSLASRDGLEDTTQQLGTPSENCSKKRLSSRTDPAQDMQDPLCIPESPQAVVVHKRRRKRKQQDGGSNASDSGSSFGDSETLRRSKRDRKTTK
ncbi:E3 ubiquitin-protein ligase RAD18-like [Asterias rubens]|uniref:E3 ubiquitin-protein ligase RAD18-like n=1 Tax=Asterias rubens TaxID=7604 RepID=UPI001455246A|nr:E3 ubiquitin-protein ligase RAD18-like [Asterias rubens]